MNNKDTARSLFYTCTNEDGSTETNEIETISSHSDISICESVKDLYMSCGLEITKLNNLLKSIPISIMQAEVQVLKNLEQLGQSNPNHNI